jgi:sugar phosphate isomerase/epimerase
MNRCIDVARVLGGAVYGPPGKGEIDRWGDNAARYAEAVAPCADHARECGVTLAFEPSLRPNVSFVHNLRDSIDLADRAGTAIVVDIGNCYHERDVMAWIDRVGERIAIVQVSDVAIGTLDAPGPCVRGLPGEGELPLRSFLECAIAAGYDGPFEIEFLGTDDVDEAAFRRSVDGMNALVSAVTSKS